MIRRAVVRAAALLIALVLFLLTGEAALRVIYRDGGSRTLGGPGNLTFEHLTNGPDQLRGRRDVGPKRPGVPRVMVLGDSITYGQGVYDWHNAWPERVATALEQSGRPWEMAVFAIPGRDIPQHLTEIERSGKAVAPDVLVYQWYVNDIEVTPHRPNNTRRWQRSPTHEWLRRHSYLYFFLDNRFTQLLPSPDRSYVDYILQDFQPGSAEWTEFERYFHAFSMDAKAIAARRIMLLYPQVPFRDRYPLQPVHDRMKAMATPHVLAIPPVAWARGSGTFEADPAAPWKQVLHVPAGQAGPVVDTREYYFLPGLIALEVGVARADARDPGPPIATVQLLDSGSNAVLASSDVEAQAGANPYQAVIVSLPLDGTEGRRVRFRVLSAGNSSWKLASIGARVDYGWEVIDLTDPLNSFNTHASLFDAHPNEAAHKVIADIVYRALTAAAPAAR